MGTYWARTGDLGPALAQHVQAWRWKFELSPSIVTQRFEKNIGAAANAQQRSRKQYLVQHRPAGWVVLPKGLD